MLAFAVAALMLYSGLFAVAGAFSNDGDKENGNDNDVALGAKNGSVFLADAATGAFTASSAISDDGTLWLWGRNLNITIGGGGVDKYIPTKFGTATDWASISYGEPHILGLKTDGTLWAAGYNNYGQLGLGPIGGTYTMMKVGTDTDWTSITAGSSNSFAIKSDGTLWAAGHNHHGQLGLGDTVDRDTFIQVGTDIDWASVSSNSNQTIAIKTDGSIWSCGQNLYGNLGLGDTVDRDTFIQVGTDIDWASVSAGYEHSLAIKTDGTLWAWGRGQFGRLGIGDNIDHSIPTQVGTANDWASVSAAGVNTFATKTDGTLWAWGQNNYGWLGTEGTMNRYVPTQIGTANDWASVSASPTHTLATKTDCTLWAWGNNNHGQLGLGDTIDRNVPTEVTFFSLTLTTYTVTYDLNGGTGTIPTEAPKVAGATFATASASGLIAPAGKQFKEWNTTAAGTGTAYAAGAIVIMPSSDLTLYAIWQDIPLVTFTVTYNLNGGTGTIPTEAPKGAGYTFAAASASGITPPVGKVFKSWNTAQSGTGTSYATGATVIMPSANLTLYAIWTEEVGGSGDGGTGGSSLSLADIMMVIIVLALIAVGFIALLKRRPIIWISLFCTAAGLTILRLIGGG